MNGIAVVIPCRDLGRTVAEAVDSVLLQTRPADEIVVIDDGSTDPETIQVLQLLKRPRTRVIFRSHAGVAAARNEGVSLTSAPALLFLDADDVLDPRCLDKLGARLDAGLDYVSCSLRAFEGASYEWKPPPLTPIDCLTRGSVHISTLMRRTLFDAVGGFDVDLPAYEDLDFWLQALKLGFRGEVLDEVLLHYRVRADSRYRKAIEEDTYIRTMRRLLERHRDVVAEGGVEVLARKEEFLVELRQRCAQLRRERGSIPLPWLPRLQRLLNERRFLLHGRVAASADAAGVLDHLPDLPQGPLRGSYDTIVFVATAAIDEAAFGAVCDSLRPGGSLLVARTAADDDAALRQAMAERFHSGAFEVEPFPELILATGRAAGGAPLARLRFQPRTGPAPGPRGGLILAWHRIAALDPDTHALCVSADRFREQIAMLRQRCTVMPLLDLLHAARARALPPDAVALTFDDGYLDALTTAAPILDGLPATFFVNTERLAELHEAWHDDLERLLPERDAQLAMHARLMPLSERARRELLDRMWTESGAARTPRDERRLLVATEVLRLSQLPGCEIGSHSAHHLQLPVHPPHVQREEVLAGKRNLETLLDRPVLSFAYPFGEHGDEAVAAVRAAGHLVAVTVEPGLVTERSDPLLLPRIEVNNCDAEELWNAMRELRTPRSPRAMRDSAHAENARRARDELAAGATQLTALPTFLIIDPTSICNARCVMCPVSFREAGDKGRDLPPEILAKLMPLIATAAHVNLFSTGEPTVAKGIDGLVREARKLAADDTPVWICTNGKRMPAALLDAVIARGVVVQFSVDGATPAVFEAVRRGIRFSELRASLAAVCSRRGSLSWPRIVFSTTLSKRNLHDLAPIFALAKEFGVDHVSFYEEDPEVPEEEAFALDESDRPAFEAQLPAIEASGVHYSNGLVFRGSNGLRAVEPERPAVPPPLHCSAPWKVFHARADGSVRTCCTLRTSMGDLNEQSVEAIWNGPRYQELRRAFAEQRGIPGTCYRCTDPLRTVG